MQNIMAILFDMYGVILEERKGNFIPYTYSYFDHKKHEKLRKMFKEDQLFTRAGNGELSSDEFLSMLGYEDPQFHMRNYIENYLTLDDEFVPFAEKYRTEYDFVLLSNDVSEWSAHITEYYKLNQYFSSKIVSGDVKCRKPERKIFELALEKIGKRPGECIFVDNSVKNLETASGLGIQVVLFNRDGENYHGMAVNSFKELGKLLNSCYKGRNGDDEGAGYGQGSVEGGSVDRGASLHTEI